MMSIHAELNQCNRLIHAYSKDIRELAQRGKPAGVMHACLAALEVQRDILVSRLANEIMRLPNAKNQ